eukprot:TRINITY_DN68110_c5_g1_i1.p2 TRINITY_DN68110_c5_g1~~TRINITY_DN68110_c5_g1_i1.p2  ORF type:complete len:116 (+),score=18.15 TRINITY_DN68110_c5_g1_i1:30-350(+)
MAGQKLTPGQRAAVIFGKCGACCCSCCRIWAAVGAIIMAFFGILIVTDNISFHQEFVGHLATNGDPNDLHDFKQKRALACFLGAAYYAVICAASWAYWFFVARHKA